MGKDKLSPLQDRGLKHQWRNHRRRLQMEAQLGLSQWDKEPSFFPRLLPPLVQGGSGGGQRLTWSGGRPDPGAADPAVALQSPSPLHSAPCWLLVPVLPLLFRALQGQDGADGEVGHPPGSLRRPPQGRESLRTRVAPRGLHQGRKGSPSPQEREGPCGSEAGEASPGHLSGSVKGACPGGPTQPGLGVP